MLLGVGEPGDLVSTYLGELLGAAWVFFCCYVGNLCEGAKRSSAGSSPPLALLWVGT